MEVHSTGEFNAYKVYRADGTGYYTSRIKIGDDQHARQFEQMLATQETPFSWWVEGNEVVQLGQDGETRFGLELRGKATMYQTCSRDGSRTGYQRVPAVPDRL
jgi:hypothetical protein